MMPPFVVFPTNRIAHFVEVSLYLFYLAQQVKLMSLLWAGIRIMIKRENKGGESNGKDIRKSEQKR